MQVALACNSAFGTDGISMFVLNNHRYLRHEGMNYHLIYSSIHSPENVVDGYVKEWCKDGDKAVFIPKRVGLLDYARKLYHYLRFEKIDVLHVHGSSSAILVEMVVAKMVGVKKNITHSHNTRGNHSIIHRILRPAVNWLADEKLACGELAGKWMYGNNGKFTIIPNCIDTNKYKYDENVRKLVRKELNIDEETLVIGHVGMFTEVKNQKFLLKLIKELNKKSERHFKLLFIGHGPLVWKVQKESECLALSNSVMFLGNRSDVPRLIMPEVCQSMPEYTEYTRGTGQWHQFKLSA